ncbi:DUF1007 family protein [Shimia sp. MMG029]|uniref:DUF1007 family protein n=1 Tax=Shimia sp. MMG029 TaxID=3021978 RepID=UPI0022FF1802|nr:DUF1007 family protein [Shimia sp. MMG029]MDA5557333.1 DUF1007 family protein [Shimia sp. MMG029]
MKNHFRKWRHTLILIVTMAYSAVFFPVPAHSHPHVYIDGGVDFVFDAQNQLSALNVTWLYDDFETLYILSSYGMSLNSEGKLDESDRQELVRLRSKWPLDFSGSAHLTRRGLAIPLEWPTDLDAHLIDGRLQLTFRRALKDAIEPSTVPFEVAFYESTYFFAFRLTNPPNLIGNSDSCTAEMIPFKSDVQNKSLQAALALLNREETPLIPNVGADFADRIVVKCE